MAKTRQQKEQLLSKLSYVLTEAKGAVLVDYQGLPVQATEKLRDTLAEQEAQFLVTKNTLLKKAMAKSGTSLPADILVHPLAVIFSPHDEVISAKAAVDFAKQHEALEVLGGFIGQRFLNVDQIKALASLPSLPQLQAQFVGTLAAPMTQFVGVLNAARSGIVNVLAAHERKLTESAS